MSGDALRREDALRARLAQWRARVRHAETLVGEALTIARHPYVAFSGGKDSLVTLAIVARLAPGIEAIWSDDELEYDEQLTFIPYAAQALGARLGICSGFARHAGWFDPWRHQPFWHAPDPAMIWTGERMESWSWRMGYDLVFTGLRKQEARYRRIALSRFGRLFRHGSGQWRCHPLAGWDVADVWAAIAEWELPYNPVYDVLTRIGVERREQRVGPLPLAAGWMLRDGWPALWLRLNARYGNQWGIIA